MLCFLARTLWALKIFLAVNKSACRRMNVLDGKRKRKREPHIEFLSWSFLFSLLSCVSFSFFLFYSFADATPNLLASGPYGLIFSSFIPFFFDIPVTTRFHVFSFRFSDKSFIYLAGLQVKDYC